MLRVERVTTFEAIKKPWMGLLSSSPRNSLFVSYEWASTWWRHFGQGALWILLVWDDDELLGIVPMCLRRSWYNGVPVRMLGMFSNKHISRSDIVCRDRVDAVARALAEFWRDHDDEWDVLRLEPLPMESPIIGPLSAELERCNLQAFPIEPTTALYYLQTDIDWTSYLRTRSQNFKGSMRKARNKLDRCGAVSFVTFDRIEDLEQGFTLFWRLAERSWKRGDARARYQIQDKAFLKDVAFECALSSDGGYEIRLLMVNDEMVGGVSLLFYNQVLYGFEVCYDEQLEFADPGRILFADMLQRYLGGDRIKEIDFNGESRFVRSWTDAARQYGVMSACNRRFYSRLVGTLKQLKRHLVRPAGR